MKSKISTVFVFLLVGCVLLIPALINYAFFVTKSENKEILVVTKEIALKKKPGLYKDSYDYDKVYKWNESGGRVSVEVSFSVKKRAEDYLIVYDICNNGKNRVLLHYEAFDKIIHGGGIFELEVGARRHVEVVGKQPPLLYWCKAGLYCETSDEFAEEMFAPYNLKMVNKYFWHLGICSTMPSPIPAEMWRD